MRLAELLCPESVEAQCLIAAVADALHDKAS